MSRRGLPKDLGTDTAAQAVPPVRCPGWRDIIEGVGASRNTGMAAVAGPGWPGAVGKCIGAGVDTVVAASAVWDQAMVSINSSKNRQQHDDSKRQMVRNDVLSCYPCVDTLRSTSRCPSDAATGLAPAGRVAVLCAGSR